MYIVVGMKDAGVKCLLFGAQETGDLAVEERGVRGDLAVPPPR